MMYLIETSFQYRIPFMTVGTALKMCQLTISFLKTEEWVRYQCTDEESNNCRLISLLENNNLRWLHDMKNCTGRRKLCGKVALRVFDEKSMGPFPSQLFARKCSLRIPGA